MPFRPRMEERLLYINGELQPGPWAATDAIRQPDALETAFTRRLAIPPTQTRPYDYTCEITSGTPPVTRRWYFERWEWRGNGVDRNELHLHNAVTELPPQLADLHDAW